MSRGPSSVLRAAWRPGRRRRLPTVVVRPKMALPATNTLAPAAMVIAAVVPSIPPSTSMSRAKIAGDLGARLHHLRHDVRDEVRPTETGEDRHAQEEVDVAQVGPHRVERRAGIERQSRPQAEAADIAR